MSQCDVILFLKNNNYFFLLFKIESSVQSHATRMYLSRNTTFVYAHLTGDRGGNGWVDGGGGELVIELVELLAGASIDKLIATEGTILYFNMQFSNVAPFNVLYIRTSLSRLAEW